MKKQILLLFFSFFIGLCYAQNTPHDSLHISGIVIDRDSMENLPYTIFKTHSKTYTSDKKGQFSFWAQKGEIIKFSHLGFKDTYIQINDTLEHSNYMLGVFLTRDTIQISEIIVVPRYENLAAEARNMPLLITPDEAYARNNVLAATNQALSQPPKAMDREMNQNMVLREQRWGTVYKNQIPPDKTIGISSESMGSMSIFVTPKKQKIQTSLEQPLNRYELDLILRIYDQKVKAILEESKTQ